MKKHTKAILIFATVLITTVSSFLFPMTAKAGQPGPEDDGKKIELELPDYVVVYT